MRQVVASHAVVASVGGAGFRPQRAAADYSGDSATPPSRLEELQTGRDGYGSVKVGPPGLSGYVWSGLAADRWFVEGLAAARCGRNPAPPNLG